MSRRRWGTTLWLTALLICVVLAVPSLADSQARIVRLSFVEGTVQVDRNTGQGFEKALLNMPIVQGIKLQAKDGGRAEVEFEDGSTVRIASNTIIEFNQLSLRDSGARVSTVTVQEGMAYVNFTGKKDEEFTVSFARENVALTEPAHFRVQVDDADASLADFSGATTVNGASGTVKVSKNQTATFDLANNDKYELAKSLEQDPSDTWDKQQEQYHQAYLSKNSYGSPYDYGVSDLNYYGDYSYVPGYGMMWQPYFAGAGWDPFMNGAWMWYPGVGYTWVSGYPWGWMPYRYGNWLFVPGAGWYWQPGRYFGGWNAIPQVPNPPQRFVPPQPPGSPGHNTVTVNRGPAVNPNGLSARSLLIREDSAGLGIPRGSVDNLRKVSSELARSGAASTTVRTDAAYATMSTRSGGTVPRTVAPSAPRTASPGMRPVPRTTTAPHRASPH